MITAIVFIQAEVARLSEIAEQIADIDGVTEVYSVTGELDLVAMVRVREIEGVSSVVLTWRHSRSQECARSPSPAITKVSPSIRPGSVPRRIRSSSECITQEDPGSTETTRPPRSTSTLPVRPRGSTPGG